MVPVIASGSGSRSQRLALLPLSAAGLMLLTIPLPSCSAFFSWDPNNQRCADPGSKCSDGFTCLGDRCVRDKSQVEGDLCSRDQQCEDPFICSPQPYDACRQDCSTDESFYESTKTCNDASYCRPFLPTVWPSGAEQPLKGACVENECSIDADCRYSNPRTICVRLQAKGEQSVYACLPKCIITWVGTTYSDNCNSKSTRQYCTPVGISGQQRLVCLDNVGEPSPDGDYCEVGLNGCERGSACVVNSNGGVCLKHCQPQDLGGNNEQCMGDLRSECSNVSGVDPRLAVCDYPPASGK